VFGARHVAPWLVELQRGAPGLELDLRLGDAPIDLVEHAIDLAIRIGRLPDSSYAATRLGTMHTAIVGAAAYLARAGEPQTPDELARHELVQHAGPFESDEVHALVVPGRHRPAKIKVALELLRERVPRLPGITRS
jgi:DNA-binding transcriptional LysR family regulator